MSRLRHSLNDASVRASALLASWSSIPDLIPARDTITLLKAHIRKTRTGDGGDGDGLAGGQGGGVTKVTDGSSRSGGKPAAAQRPKAPSIAEVSTPGSRKPSGKPRTVSRSASAASLAGPSTPKPRAVSRSSSTASLASDARKQDVRALLAASGSKKTRRAVHSGKGKSRADEPRDVVEISSDSE